MSRIDESTPVSPSLEQLFGRQQVSRKLPVDKRVFYLTIQAVFNALFIGLIAKLLVSLIALITNFAFFGRFSIESSSPAGNHLGWFVIFIPVAGSLLVGLMARFGSKAIRGHGIPEAMEKIILEDSKIPPVITFLKPLSAAISIGTGGPFGAEGPIIATGGALGSLTGQAMHISPAERKIILTAGACAGMSAIFGSPLAAVLLAIELLLFEFSPRSIIPVALGCITGAGMHILLFDNNPVFSMPAIPVPSNSALIIYVILGVLIGIIASFVSRSVYAVEDLFEKLPIHWMWWPALGAIAVGITGYFAPRTMGVGYNNITDLLAGSLPLGMLLTLCFLKYISWVISLGSGTSGGTLAPLFTIGGASGALLGTAALHFFPSLDINLPTAALIGMAAMFSGASRAFLTSIVFALETTGQVNGLLPLLAACASAYFVSFFFMKGSIMTEKIKRRGVKTPDSYEPDVLQLTNVLKLVSDMPAGKVNLPYVYTTDDAGLAAEMMGKYSKDTLLVLDNKESRQSVGVITAAAILKYYSDQKNKNHVYDSPARTRKIMVHGRKLMMKMQRK
ncbi:chloride channel protein [Flavihumibacter profundi]|uniref:chloride channel protein n=1 Tax=Flavihumibacter profundi TaxID=2716883 RepID=UPI001CC5FF3C|nr:chloride channel protein [Flavihumibacter profundi]MBZ5856983.1 chloride channel protein [Flavihumibacter profundi]